MTPAAIRPKTFPSASPSTKLPASRSNMTCLLKEFRAKAAAMAQPATLLILLLASTASHAKIYVPVKWTFSAKQSAPGEAVLTFKANIDKGWHIYSQHTPQAIMSPIPMSFVFEVNKCYSLIGRVNEPPAHEEYD